MAAGSTRRAAPHPTDDAFVHLFDVLQEGVYICLRTADANATLAANPHQRLMFGWTAEVPLADVTPLAPDHFVDEQARTDLLQQFRYVERLVLEQPGGVVQGRELLDPLAEVVHRAPGTVALVGHFLPQPFECVHLRDVLDGQRHDAECAQK